MKFLKAISPYIVIIGIIVLIVCIIASYVRPEEITYTEFVKELSAQNVGKITLEDNYAELTIKEDSAETNLKKGKYSLKILSQDTFEKQLSDEIKAGNPVKYKAVVRHVPFILKILPYVLLSLLVVFVFYVLISQSQGAGTKAMNFGRSRARMYTTSKVKFSDVAGAEEEKEEMQEIVAFLKNPKKYTQMGARIPRGVLLIGPPGTGKTYLAKAVAGEAGVPFFSISGSDFVELYVGVGASRVRDLFEQAKKNSPCIIFIDEIDAVGRHRGSGLGGGHDEREQTLNQMLVEMDGFGGNESVIVMAATNRPDILDPALTRPGRFDRKIIINLPDIKAREEILTIHSKNKPLDETVVLSDVAKITAGFTAADLANLLNEAALIAARKDNEKISSENIKEATFRVIVGPEKKSRVMTEKDKWLTAVHEVGHAIAVKLLSSTNKVDRISAVPAGSAGGYTAYRPDHDETYVTKSQLIEDIMVSLGGRAAEELVLHEISTGASSDLKHANRIAMNIVSKYGMSDAIGNMVFDHGSEEVYLGKTYGNTYHYSESTASLIDREAKMVIDDAYDRVKKVLSDNMDKLQSISKLLIEKERIEGNEFEELMAQ